MTTTQDVVTAFVDGRKAKASSGSLVSYGDRIESYGKPIASFSNASLNGKALVHLNTRRYSVTSSKHRNMVWRALEASGRYEVEAYEFGEARETADGTGRCPQCGAPAGMRCKHRHY